MKADTMSVLTLPQGGLMDMPSQVVSDKLLVCDLKSPVLAASLSAIKLPTTNPIRTKHLIHTLPSEALSSGADNEKSAVMLLNHVNDGAADHSLESNLEPVMLVSADNVDTKDLSLSSDVPVQANDETDVNSSDVMCETETTVLDNGVATVLPTASSVAPPVLKSAASVVAVSNEHSSPVDAIERSQTVSNKQVHGPMVGRKSSQTVISNSVNGMGSLVHTVAPSNLAVPQQTLPITSTSEAKTKSDKKLKRSLNASGQCGELELHNNGVVERQGQPSHLAASPNNVTVIREVYENGSAMEYFAMQLDFALDSGVNTIIIEPSRLGRETTQWLRIGCFLRRMAVVSGSASIIAGAFGQDSACLPLGTLAGIASIIYIASWRPDPCALYRVERNVQRLQRLPLPKVSCTQPVVLVRCNRMRLKNGLHDSVSAAALAMCLWRLYRWYYN